MSISDAEVMGRAAIQHLEEAMQALTGARESAESAQDRIVAMFGESYDAPSLGEMLALVGDQDGLKGIVDQGVEQAMHSIEVIEAYIARIRAAGA